MASERARHEFVRLTEQDALAHDTDTLVAWEVAGTWVNALEQYFPRYRANRVIRSVLAMNVPYVVPPFSLPGLDTSYRLFSGLAVFQPIIWRGTDGRDDFHLSTDDLASRINGLERGSLRFIYTSSDGGFELRDVHDLMRKLEGHVEVVSSKSMATLASQKGNPNANGIVPDLIDIITGVIPTSEEAEPSLRGSDPDLP